MNYLQTLIDFNTFLVHYKPEEFKNPADVGAITSMFDCSEQELADMLYTLKSMGNVAGVTLANNVLSIVCIKNECRSEISLLHTDCLVFDYLKLRKQYGRLNYPGRDN